MDDCIGVNHHRTKLATIYDDRTRSKINNISKFYNGSYIFITGATGFLGKILIEKLLRSCDSLEQIYVLIRKKKQLNANERLKLMFQSPVFQKLRKTNPKMFEKVIVLHGDVALPKLGLSAADRRVIIDNVNVVFHAAATVSFNADLQSILNLNTYGTQKVAELCRSIKYLKSVIFVSSVASNTNKCKAEEIVYDPPYDPMSIVNCVNTLPPNVIKLIEKQILGKYPNTYSFSKSLAEAVFYEYCKDLPAAIVRPGGVISAWKEPFAGWIEITGAGTMLMTACVQGLIKSMKVRREIPASFIPVDIVANTLSAAAWYNGTHRSNTLRVYHCTSEQVNDLSFGQYMDLIQKHIREYPARRGNFYQGFRYTTNALTQNVSNILFHYAPAYLIDAYLYSTNKKLRMVKISKSIVKGLRESEFITTIEHHCNSKNFQLLIEAVQTAEDGPNFNIDISQKKGFDWDEYIKLYVMGIRKHILKDKMASNLKKLNSTNKTIGVASKL